MNEQRQHSPLTLALGSVAFVAGLATVLGRVGGRRWLRLVGLCSYLVVVGGRRPEPALLREALRASGSDTVAPYWGHRAPESGAVPSFMLAERARMPSAPRP